MPKLTATVYRSRPPEVRYAFVVVGEKSLHMGMSYDGLAYALKHDIPTDFVVVDFTTGKNYKADALDFATWWKANYLNAEANYESERQ